MDRGPSLLEQIESLNNSINGSSRFDSRNSLKNQQGVGSSPIEEEKLDFSSHLEQSNRKPSSNIGL